ncbi:MAG: chromosomal replication initiator protein DnaA [Deltaproteobacteria bacterium]
MSSNSWTQIRERLKASLPAHIFSSLVEPSSFFEKEDSYEISFPNRFTKESFEEKCLSPLKNALKTLSLDAKRIELLVAASNQESAQQTFIDPSSFSRFDPKYRFDTFVIGTSNQFAHAACQAVSKQPGQCYNPLFIFGGAGLGKTHLLRAIGYELSKNQSNLRILFLTSEAFTNELIQAIRIDRMREFREKYRSGCDVLLLDDIHFLAGKERTQEEFFYTFNYLHESRKQIVITSDRYPKDIQGLENRLQTRFEWGLVADVQPPEVETRVAILKNKAEEQKISLPDDVAHYVASHVTSNIRELEGSLHRLQAHASLNNSSINLDLAQQILRDLVPRLKHELTADGVLKLVALTFGLKIADLKSNKRARNLSEPRQICMYLLRKHLMMSLPEIGAFMGDRHHTTILHGVNEIISRSKTDPELEINISKIESLFR